MIFKLMTRIVATWKEPGPVAMKAAKPLVDDGRPLLDILEAGLAACELDLDLIAIGAGSIPNTDGELELDASMMCGDTLQAGAVCGVRGIVPVISVARIVLEQTPHVMLCGDNARRFAIEHGFKPQLLTTGEIYKRWQDWKASGAPVMPLDRDEYVHHSGDNPHDTVTMLGVQGGKTCAASSTSGMPWKIPGRVGDSPIIGAGIYADDEAGCAGATGWGEELWKACASFRTVEAMKRGMSPQEACEDTIRHMYRRHPNKFRLPCVVLAMNPQGEVGAACGGGDFDFWTMDDGGEPVMHHRDPMFD